MDEKGIQVSSESRSKKLTYSVFSGMVMVGEIQTSLHRSYICTDEVFETFAGACTGNMAEDRKLRPLAFLLSCPYMGGEA